MKNRARNPRLKGTRVNPLKLDPTRTTMLRRAAIADVRRRFARLILAIDTLIVKEDSFGLARRREGPRSPFTTNAFCPTGPGGGVDPTCSPNAGGVRVPIEQMTGDVKESERLSLPVKDGIRAKNETCSVWGDCTNQAFKAWERGEGDVYFGWAIPKENLERAYDYHEKTVKEFGPPKEYYQSVSGMFAHAWNVKDGQIIDHAMGSDRAKDYVYFGKPVPESTLRSVKHGDDLAYLDYQSMKMTTTNVFCPTGEGGGVDPSCSPGGSGGVLIKTMKNVGVSGTFDGTLYRATTGHAKATADRYGEASPEWGMYVTDKLSTAKMYGGGIKKFKAIGLRVLGSMSSEYRDIQDHLGGISSKDEIKREAARRGWDAINEGGSDGVVILGGKSSRLKMVKNASMTTNERWELKSSPEQLAAFQEWLKKQLRWYVVGMTEDMLWARYVQEGFRKGAGRAFDDLRSKRGPTFRSDDFTQGQRQQFLATSFRRPETVEKVKILASRTFEELTNVGEEIRLKLGRVLTDGLARGDNPRVVAREMTRQLAIPQRRAETIARTEIIRAHAEGQLSAMEDLGVDEVGVMVEWSTAGDDRVCEACAPMEGVVLKLEEAHGMIPRHPNCRCSFIPANVGESRKEQVRGKAKIEKQIDLSARLAGDTFDVGIEIDKNRPRAPVSPTKNAFCPTGPGGGVDPTCGASEGGGSMIAPLRYRDHKGTNHEHNAEIVKASKVKVIAPEKYKKDVTEALAHVLESKFLSKQMEGVTVEVTSLGNRHGNMSKHLYVSQESLEQYGPGFMATIVRHELEHKILTLQGVPSSKQESRVRHTAGTWAAIKYGTMAKTNPRAAEGFKKAAIEQGVKVL